jgi:hypothetical protein
LPPRTKVELDIRTSHGFYDVREEHASADCIQLEYDEWDQTARLIGDDD